MKDRPKNVVKMLPLLSLALGLAACSGGGPGVSSSAPTVSATHAPAGLAPVSDGWFVELSGDPTALSAQSVGSQQATFRAQAAAQGLRYQEVASYHTLFNGFSVRATPAELARLSRLPGVANVYPVQRTELPRTVRELATALRPDVMSALTMTGADIAQNELGLSGRGVKVAVIDSGLDLNHPAFKGRVVAGYDFVGDRFGSKDPATGVTDSTPVPDATPNDCEGNGTHVAGIVGGNDPAGGFKGVAPDVSFGIYRVFGCAGSTRSDIVLLAMERALADGMQVVNLSAGAAFQWPQYPTARAASRLVKRGVVVSAAAGNSGGDGQYSLSAPALGENVMAVASVENTRLQLRTFTPTPGGGSIGYQPATGAPDAPTGLNLNVTKLPGSGPTTSNDGCSIDGLNPYAPGSLNGQAALIRLGTCSPREKALNAQRAGAGAVVIYNDGPGFLTPDVASQTGNDAIQIPVVSVLAGDGVKIDGLIGAGVRLTFDGGTQTFGNPTGNLISDFSAYGVSPDLELKPDLAAPGGQIRSASPLSVDPGGYAVLSGTSLAAPQVAGLSALLLQAFPTLQASDMRTRLMNNAQIRGFLSGGTLLEGVPTSVQQQGAGLVNVVAAYRNPVTATPSKLSLGESQSLAVGSKVVVLKNSGTAPQTFRVSHLPARTLAGTTLAPRPGTQTAALTIDGQNADTGRLTVTVPAGGETELNVLVTPPAAAAEASQYGGYVVLEGSVGHSMVIPYAGFKGDYQGIRALGNVSLDGGRTFQKFPALYDPGEDLFYAADAAVPAPPDYTLTGGDEPTLLVNLAHQAQRITLDVLDAGGARIDTVLRQEYVGRNATNIYTTPASDAFSFLGWDGKLSSGTTAPAGTYQLRLSVLRALGDPSNPAHTETYTTQKFRIVR